MPEFPPVFVLGCQRSGTTMLRLVLDSHSRIACPPESRFLVQLAKVVEIAECRKGLLDMGFSEEDILERMREFTESFFVDYCRRRGKVRWADKNLHNLDHVNTIDRMFNHTPLYVGIVRHGLDVAYSLMDYDWGVLRRRMTGGAPKHVAAARLWADQNQKLLSWGEQAGDRMFLVRYEEVTAEPERLLRNIFAFLDEPWEPEVLRYDCRQHDLGYGDVKAVSYKGIVANSGRYRSWPDSVQEEVFETARDMFEELNYTR